MFSVSDLSFITSTLLCCFVSILGFYWYNKYFNHYWKNKGIPHEEPRSIFHFVFSMLKGVSQGKAYQEVERDKYLKHGLLFGGYEVTNPVLYVADPELLKLIMVKDFSNFEDRRSMNFDSQKYYCDFLPFATGEKWRRLRTIISPTFTSGKLKGMMGSFQECAEHFRDNFERKSNSNVSVNCTKLCLNFTMDVIASVAFGTKLDSHNDPNNPFVENALKAVTFGNTWQLLFFAICPKLCLRLGFNSDKCDFFADLTRSIIERRRKNNEVRNDFLQLLMDHLDDSEQSKNSYNKVLSMDELISQCIQFFLAGFDSTGVTITLVLYNLAVHPQAQEKFIAEVDNYWKNEKGADMTSSKGTHYIEACISETLRIYPRGTRLERVSKSDYELANTGVTIPKGMAVVIPTYCIQRDERFFPEPLKFSPERFLPENADSIAPFTYLPFGNGPRNCIAMRLALLIVKVSLLHLFKGVSFTTCPETLIPLEFSGSANFFQPKDVYLKAIRRSSN